MRDALSIIYVLRTTNNQKYNIEPIIQGYNVCWTYTAVHNTDCQYFYSGFVFDLLCVSNIGTYIYYGRFMFNSSCLWSKIKFKQFQ